MAAFAFAEFLCKPSFAARSDWVQHSSLFLEKCNVSKTCKTFAQDHDLPGTVAGPCRRRNSGTGAKDESESHDWPSCWPNKLLGLRAKPL